MALSSSPRKVVPLAGGPDWQPVQKHNPTGPALTKRVFYCGVVVENSDNGRRLPQDVQDLVASLGEPLGSDSDSSLLASPSQMCLDSELDHGRTRTAAMMESSALTDVINELVSTERSYVRRLRILKHDYADPLRKFSRNKDTAILPPYEAKILFGNVDNLLPVNEAFLADLEKMLGSNEARSLSGIGDVALRHFRDLRGFEHYKGYYDKREEAQSIFLHEMAKKSSGFAAYIDRIKYSNADARNRVGLRELLMDPVQRIPRYTLMFRTMIKHMDPGDPQRQKLVLADEIASKIALAEADEQTKQAAIWYCLSATVDGFPPGIISNSRRFIDCIDVEDVASDPTVSLSASGSATPSAGSLHCTLFLFDDKLVIAKRPGNGEKSGRALTGLDEMEKLTKAGGLPTGMKKSGMTFKGVVDVTDVVAVDVSGTDMHFYLEIPPQGQSDRWSGRPFRAFSVVHPPLPVNFDPTRSEVDKVRFLENLWNAQATYRTKAGQSVVLSGEETEVESRGGRVTLARTYFNVYQRKAFLQESKKTKIVVHVDSLGSADPIPFGINGPPFVRVRVQPIAGELSRYTVTSSDPNDETEEDIVQTARVPARIVQTIHQFGLFKFRTGNISAPSTPTIRSRAHIFNLDAISRNLFSARPGSAKGDLFGGTVNGSKRSKSSVSKSSTVTQTTTTADDSLMKFSSRSNSTVTVATTMSILDDEAFFGSGGSSASRSRSRTRKLLKRKSKSPGGSGSDPEIASPRRPGLRSNAGSRSTSRERGFEYSDPDDDGKTLSQQTRDMDESDADLSMRLALARKNSQSQHGQHAGSLVSEQPIEETIYEDEPPHPIRPASRASRDTASRRSTTPTPRAPTPIESPFQARSTSQHSSERRPMGPRAPSPLPPKSPLLLPSEIPDADMSLENIHINVSQPLTHPRSENVILLHSRNNRQPFQPTGNTDATPKHPASGAVPPSTEPLSIKKKVSVRTNASAGSPTPIRKTFTRNSPLNRASARITSPRRISPQVKAVRTIAITHRSSKSADTERMIQLAQTTKEDIESSRRAVKRIRLGLDSFQSSAPSSGSEDYWRPSSPLKGLSRTPQRSSAVVTREAQDRMNEMRQLIGKRLEGEGTPRSRAGILPAPRTMDPFSADGIAQTLQDVVSDADQELTRAALNHETMQDDLKVLASDFKEKSTDLEKARVELQNTKRQCELVKSLLADATAEKEIMYEAFNEELDGMYNDANLPEDEAWTSMIRDLQKTKEARNALTKENSQLKRRLAEVESQHEEWSTLLRAHCLVP